MTLGEKQRLFSELVGRLIGFIYDQGYAVSLGDAYRDPRVYGEPGRSMPGGYGRRWSNHKSRLAIDLNLFKKDASGKWQYCTSTEDHREIGEFWESLSPLCSWGGHYDDGNHYSFKHNGRR